MFLLLAVVAVSRVVTMADQNQQLLAEFISHRRCALFIGHDLGESASGFRGLPTTWQLADELAADCGYCGRYRSLPEVAGIFKQKRGRWALVRFLQDRIDVPDYRPLPIHHVIATIPFPVIVNAAWDTLLQQALDQQGTRYQIVRRDIDLGYLDTTAGTVLYRPYGSLSEPDSVVVCEEDQLNVFYDQSRVVERLKGVIEQYSLLLVGYAPAQDTVFVRMYHDIRRSQRDHKPPAFAVQLLNRAVDAAEWEARGVRPIIADPTAFMRDLAYSVAAAENRTLILPDLAEISNAPRLTAAELSVQAELLDSALDRIGVSDLVEQTDVPLLSEEQLRDIEAMRASYERLVRDFAPEQTSSRVWLRQGNIEYVRQNYDRAEDYYRHALAAEPGLAEAYHNLHYVTLARGDLVNAMAAYQHATDLRPELALLPPRYRVDAVLGGGAFGAVYRAWDSQTGQSVAVKVLQSQQARTEGALTSFKREAFVLQGLAHPNIVRLLDFQAYRGSYFIVFECLDGQTLKAALRATDRPFSLVRAYRIMEQICAGLAYTHAHDIIHRDLKPSNVFLTGDLVKLIDFGLAHPIAPGQLSTIQGATGTIGYMAPEQAEGRATDCRTDVYAAGTIFYEMITGRNPGEGTYWPPSALLPGLNDSLDLVIEKARERAPDDRYASIAEFHAELGRIVAMQAAAKDAPWLRRFTARGAQFLKVGTERGWPFLLLAALATGFVLPVLPGSTNQISQIARSISVGLFIVLVLAPLTGWFTLAVARRTRSPSIAAYGRAMGVLLALASTVLWLGAFTFAPPIYNIGSADAELYLEALLIDYLSTSLGLTFLVFVTLVASGMLTKRMLGCYATGFFLAFAFWLLCLSLGGIMLPIVAGSGWYAMLA
jgi:tetratricopeptide (TPR) repeat protein